MAGHGLAKTVAFLSSGHILHRHGSTRTADVRALATRMPVLAGLFGLAILALLGFPPASLFASELGIARAGTAAGLGWATAAAFGLALVAFAGLTVHSGRMLLCPQPEPVDQPVALPVGTALPLVAGLLGVAVLGVTLGPASDLLHTAVNLVATP